LSESTIFKEFLAGISRVPELDRSTSNSYEFKIIWFLGPLDIEDGIRSSRELKEHLLALNVVNIHSMVIALVNTSNISLAWTDGKSGYTLCLSTQVELSQRLHVGSIPDMDG